MTDSPSESGQYCPVCNATLQLHAVLCVECGYHLKFKRHVAPAANPQSTLSFDQDDNPYRSPSSTTSSVADGEPSAAGRLLATLFSFRGRVPRSHWWACQGIYFGVVIVAGTLFASDVIPELAGNIMIWACWWPVLANQVKRWHDMDKSGLWVLINLIPCVGPIWAFIELGLQRGTVGFNEFGDDPLQ